MGRFENIQAAIRGLAIAYSAYNSASEHDDSNGVVVWGEELIEAQEATGVELHSPDGIRRHVKLHRPLQAHLQREAA
jgi:hypothetical protein